MLIPLTEAEFQRQVTDLADRLGWRWMHVERMGNDQGRWRTATSGPLGKGWPDLVLVKGATMLFAELKAQKGIQTPAQKELASVLMWIAPYYVWRPSDFPMILSVLTNAA